MHVQQRTHSSHPLRGAVFAWKRFPGYAKNTYPGLRSLQPFGLATPEACKKISPGRSVFCDTRGECLQE
jgi:hypothetical protein